MTGISSLVGAIAGIRPTSINRGLLNGGNVGDQSYPYYGVVKISVGTVVASTLKTVLSITGRGALTWLGFWNSNTTIRTGRIKITLDDVVVYDRTSDAGTVAGALHRVHGSVANGSSTFNSEPVEAVPLLFESSLLIEYASSLSETNNTTVGYIYYTR